MTANMQDYNNPQLPRYLKGGEGGKTHSQTNQQTEHSANHTVKYHQAEHRMVRLLTIAKQVTFNIQQPEPLNAYTADRGLMELS